ncbi:MAG: SpoIIE family protein phosphatase [Planctomycetes bacterium]|nr:SpoIIE family protein phosphatase [Planctomycetota bacterium]
MKSGSKVLVVDDEILDRKLVIKGLQGLEGVEVLEAEDGPSAQELLARQAVDVVITDVIMPGMDGLDLLRWARKNCPGATWIILSGVDTFDAAVEAIHLGAFDFLQKPPNVKSIEVAVRNALNERRLLQQEEKLHRALENKVRQLEGLCRVLQNQAEQIQDDISRAETIQRALLPQTAPRVEGLTIHSLYRPGRYLGGDLYDVLAVNDDTLVIYVADASGHGVAATMLSVLFKQRLHVVDSLTGKPLTPAQALKAANSDLCRAISRSGMFVTAAYGVLDVKRRRLCLASAGNPPLQLARADRSVSEIRCTGPALGLSPTTSFAEQEVILQPGDRLLLYTDGLIDQPAARLLTRQDLAQILASTDNSGSRLLKALFRAATAGTGEERDDVTMVYLQVRSGESRLDNTALDDEESEAEILAPPLIALFHGESKGTIFLKIRGRGTYRQADSVHGWTVRRIETKQPVTIDLAECEYLDSTFLGVLHALVELAVSTGVRIRLQAVQEDIRHLLRELDMSLVLAQISEEIQPLPPAMQPLAEPADDVKPDYAKILWAHEILSSLSERNRKKFRFVVETLREELGEELAEI